MFYDYCTLFLVPPPPLPFFDIFSRFQIFNDLQYYTKKRIQERTNITKIDKITYYNRINDKYNVYFRLKVL